MTAVEAGLLYLAGGLSVLPIKPDGSKAPYGNTWKTLQEIRPTEDQVRNWPSDCGVAIIGGEVSGNLAIIDIEYADFYHKFCEIVSAQDATLIASLPQVITPGKEHTGGRHIYFRSPILVRSGKKASLTKEEGERRGSRTAIEVKAEGGYVLAPGCPAACHTSGRLYKHFSGPAIADTPLITQEQVSLLLSAAVSLNCDIADDKDKRELSKPTTFSPGAIHDRPGDVFNKQASWAEILEPHGWKKCYSKDNEEYWRRPNKQSGISASAGHCHTEQSGSLLYVFSSNAQPFDEGRTYSKFTAYSKLNHGGDYKVAADALAEKFGLFQLPEGVVVNPACETPQRKLDVLLENDRKFKLSWQRQRPDFHSAWSYELSLAVKAAECQWTDQEIVDLIVVFKRTWEPGNEIRSTDLAKILAKAKESREKSSTDALKQEVDNLKKLQADKSGEKETEKKESAAKVFELVSSKLGINVARVEKYYDEDEPVFWLYLDTGEKITLGTAAALLNQNIVRAKIAGAVHDVPNRLKGDKWDEVARALLRACIVIRKGDQGTVKGQVKAWITEYLDAHEPEEAVNEKVIEDRKSHCQGDDVCFFLSEFRNFLRVRHGDNHSSKSLGAMFHQSGVEVRMIRYKKTTRTVWCVNLNLLNGVSKEEAVELKEEEKNGEAVTVVSL